MASILAAMEAATIMEKRFEAWQRHDYLERLRAGELEAEDEKRKLLETSARLPSQEGFLRSFFFWKAWLRGPERRETCKFSGS